MSDRVRNSLGEDLGHIEELMIDLEHQRIAYAVLSFGGFLGIGNKLFAVPLDAFSIDTEKHELILDIEREKLESAPGFDKDDWPSTSDRLWTSKVYEYYGTAPYWS